MVAAVLLVLATLADLRLRVVAPAKATAPLVRAAAILSGAAVLIGLAVGVSNGSGVIWACAVLGSEAVLVTVLASAICAGWPVRRWSRVLDRAMILRWLVAAVLIAVLPGSALIAVAVMTLGAAVAAMGIAIWEASQHDSAGPRVIGAWERLLDAGPALRGMAHLMRKTAAPRTASAVTAVVIWFAFAMPLLDGTERRARFLLAAELLVLVALGMALRSGLAGRLSWALPVVGIVIEVFTVGRLVQTTVPGAEAAGLVLIAVMVAHRAELASSTVMGRPMPPAWARHAGLGFDGRMLAVTAICAVLGVESGPAIWILAGYLAAVFVGGRLLAGRVKARATVSESGSATPPADDRDESLSESSTSEGVVDLRDQSATPLASPQTTR